MKSIGNIACNVKYNPDETRHPPPANREESERDSELEKYIRGMHMQVFWLNLTHLSSQI